jgi:hypothetical protein
LEVERVVDMGDHRHALGWVLGARVDVRLQPGDRAPGPSERIAVTSRQVVPLP